MIATLIALGSNLGERPRALRHALWTLQRRGIVRLRRCSDFLETEPVGGPEQGWYVNAVAWAETRREPRSLLAALQAEERRAGRSPGGVRNGPRVLDLDLLLFGDARCASDELELPHPRMAERAFVLRPAVQIAPRWVHPARGLRLEELWRSLSCSA
ncbi:MAG: 2-amino-4-hydroxy-6-hydroxymethyldihydropteridine diphosphokinase [Planctomycetes bacterium]|nr:2-amino-4-hydroxy-6-hydroxymethyldihydropteridine diphosphokinase [Planctomycetota bacterium]